MAQSMSTTERLASIITHLGGPPTNAVDIQWAIDLPAGRKLVEWLARQLTLDDSDDGEISIAEKTYRLQAELEGIALEDEEVQTWVRALNKTTWNSVFLTLDMRLKRARMSESDASKDSRCVPLFQSGYPLPSRQKARVKYIHNESSLLEGEAELLKARLRQTKEVFRSMSQTIRDIQSGIERADEDIRQKQDLLGELSIDSDTVISSSIQSANHLLDALASQCIPEDNDGQEQQHHIDLNSVATSLSSISSLRLSIVDHFHSQKHSIDQAAACLPASQEIKAEASRLHETFNPTNSKAPSLLEEAAEATFVKEVLEICSNLDGAVTGREYLSKVLKEGDINDGYVKSQTGLNVKSELEHGWALDQEAILKSRSQILDEAITSFNALLQPLDSLHNDLLFTEHQIQEAEALLGALGEEIEEIVDDVRNTKENSESPSPRAIVEVADEILERELVDLQKRSKDIRPAQAAPLVLLDRNDVIKELASIFDRMKDLDDQEASRNSGLPETLSTSLSTHAPLLAASYAHSPMNTSPPFALPIEVQALENEGKSKADHLGEVVEHLEKETEVLESARIKRKLCAFLDQWGRGAV